MTIMVAVIVRASAAPTRAPSRAREGPQRIQILHLSDCGRVCLIIIIFVLHASFAQTCAAAPSTSGATAVRLLIRRRPPRNRVVARERRQVALVGAQPAKVVVVVVVVVAIAASRGESVAGRRRPQDLLVALVQVASVDYRIQLRLIQ